MPLIAESPPVNFMASGELGNTKSKCTLIATDLITGKTFIVEKNCEDDNRQADSLAREEVFLLLSTARP